MNHDAQAAGEGSPRRDLSGSGRRQFVAALLAGFDRPGIEQVTRFSLDQDLEEIAGGENLRDSTFNLVEWAIENGRLNDLVTGALAENPNSPELKTFVRDVWSKPQTLSPNGPIGPDESEGAPTQKPGSFWKSPAGMLLGIVAFIAAIGMLYFGLTNPAMLGNRSDAGSTPRVSISNATLRQVQTNEAGDELLNIALDAGREIVQHDDRARIVVVAKSENRVVPGLENLASPRPDLSALAPDPDQRRQRRGLVMGKRASTRGTSPRDRRGSRAAASNR